MRSWVRTAQKDFFEENKMIDRDQMVLKESDMDLVSEHKVFGAVVEKRKKRKAGKLIHLYSEDDERYYHVDTFSDFWLSDLAGLLKKLQSKESKWVVVMFLAARPDDTAQEDLLKTYVGPEELFIIGKEVYVYYTNGIGRSKLSHSFIEKKLRTFGTARNWNTILQLQKLIQY